MENQDILTNYTHSSAHTKTREKKPTRSVIVDL